MSCPCRLCNAREFFQDIHYRDGKYSYEPEVTPEEPKSVWERLSKVSDELKAYGVPAHFINELNDLCDQIDGIDSDVIELQKKAKNDFSIDLGNISKKLY